MISLDHILFIDIETVSAFAEMKMLNERMQACWQHKGSRIDANEDASKLYVDKAAIYAEFGRVITIAIGYFTGEAAERQLKVKTIFDHDEKELLLKLNEILNKFENKNRKLCAHNGKEFDYPYLCRRMIINGIALPKILDIASLKPWEVPHLDTMEMWKYGDKKNYTSLELLAAVLDVPTSKSDIDGSQVGRVYYENNELERIAEYCALDVVTTAQVYLRLMLQPLVAEKNIVIVK